jgi:hypothetical protein
VVVARTGERYSWRRPETEPGQQPPSVLESNSGSAAQQGLDVLRRYGAARGLEVHREAQAGVGTIIRFVDPRTHQVVRQFPAAPIERQVKALHARMGRRLDQQV